MKRLVLLVIFCLSIVSACGLSPEGIASQTATAATALAASWTKTPTLTPTFTPTSTPTATFTPTPIPTPLGGSNGRLLFFRDSAIYSFDITNQTTEVLVTQQQLLEALLMKRTYAVGILGIISPDGKKAIVFGCGDSKCTEGRIRIALLTLNLSIVKRLNFGYLVETVQWSDDSQKVLLQINQLGSNVSGSLTYIINSDEATFGNLVSLDMAFSAALSPDGKQVYYSTLKDYKVVNSDGTDERVLAQGLSHSMAVAHDGLNIALNDASKGIVIVDSGLSNSQVLSSVSSDLGTEIQWSPDSKYLFTFTPINRKLTAIEMDTEIITTFGMPKGANYTWLCGWSPDSRLFSYVAAFSFDPFHYSIFFQDVNGEEPVKLTSFEDGVEWCPTWLLSQ